MTQREMNWKIIRSIIPIIALGAIIYYSKSAQPNYETEEPILTTDARELVWRFQMDAAQNLLFQVVQVDGRVTGKDSLLVILNHNLICAPDPKTTLNVSIGDSITITGRCIGYDDLLEEARMDHSFLKAKH